MILQADLTGERLAGEINGLAAEPAQLMKMGRALREMSRPDAAAAAADLIEKLDRK